MQIVDLQIHLWENARMSPQHRQIPTYDVNDALKEMAEAGVDAAVIHPPSTLGEGPNARRSKRSRPIPTNSASSAISTCRPRIARRSSRLVAAAGHARLPLYVQPAASGELVVGRLARLVLGRLRARKIAGRPDGWRPYGRPRPHRRAPSRPQIAHRPPRPRRQWRDRHDAPPLPISATCWRSPNIPMSRSNCRVRQLLSEPYPYATSTNTSAGS